MVSITFGNRLVGPEKAGNSVGHLSEVDGSGLGYGLRCPSQFWCNFGFSTSSSQTAFSILVH
jgi:hypothetical protein